MSLDIAARRAKFGARSKREAMMTAHSIVAVLIENYLGQGVPESGGVEADVPQEDILRLEAAIEQLQVRHEGRAVRR